MNNNGKTPQYINTAQNDCINKTIGGAINHLLSNEKIKTMVLPLAVPTGFGKTRIAIQGIFNTKNQKTKDFVEGTVILWPQKKDHHNQMWVSATNWVKKITSDTKDDRFEYTKGKKIKWVRLEKGKDDEKPVIYNKKKMLYVLDKDAEGLKKYSSLGKKLSDKNIFFIIDEWHGKKIIEEFQTFKSKESNLEKRAEIFWRKKLLPPGLDKKNRFKKNLFVLLVSATPIATTVNMDEKKLINISENGDKKFQEYIETAYEAFQILTKIGYKSNKFNILDNDYNSLIAKEVDKLKSNSKRDDFESFKKNEFAKQYVEYLKDMAKRHFLNKTDIYLREQKNFASDLKNYKLQTLLNFVNSPQNQKKNYVVFCHYLTAVASKLEKFLKDKVENGYAFYDGSSYEQDSELKVSCSKAKKIFNKEAPSPIKGKPLRILIVTDKDSQGIDLHKSRADIIHYELSWNPIRIIQRFGRVWRIIRGAKTTRMTKPHAYYMPYTYSSEEEQINRLRRRWEFLEKIDKDMTEEKQKKKRSSMRFTPISMKIALGERLTPKP